MCVVKIFAFLCKVSKQRYAVEKKKPQNTPFKLKSPKNANKT